MKSITKSLILGLVSAMLLIALAGCGNQDANTTGQTAKPNKVGGTKPMPGNASTPENM